MRNLRATQRCVRLSRTACECKTHIHMHDTCTESTTKTKLRHTPRHILSNASSRFMHLQTDATLAWEQAQLRNTAVSVDVEIWRESYWQESKTRKTWPLPPANCEKKRGKDVGAGLSLACKNVLCTLALRNSLAMIAVPLLLKICLTTARKGATSDSLNTQSLASTRCADACRGANCELQRPH